MTTRISPRMLWAAFAVTVAGTALTRVLSHYFPGQPILRMSNWQVLQAAASAISVYYCLLVRRDQRQGSAMRTAWTLLALAAGCGWVRHVFEFGGGLAGWNRMPEVMNLQMIPITLELWLLTVGLAIMLRSFVALRLGVRLRWTDVLWLLVIASMAPAVFAMRANLSAANSAHPLLRDLQALGPAFQAVAALTGVLLHRALQDMDGGGLAKSLRLIVAFLMCRMLANVVRSWPELNNDPVVSLMVLAIGRGSSWLFTLAVCLRWRLTQTANSLAERYSAAGSLAAMEPR